MSEQVLVIPGRMLGRNEREGLARAHWSKACKAKKRETEMVAELARAARMKPVEGPCEVSIVYVEQVRFFKNGKHKKLRDVDNVADAQKPILDGLVEAGVLPDDGPEWVRRVIPVVKYQRDDPHITVMVMDYEPERRVVYPPVNVPESECR